MKRLGLPLRLALLALVAVAGFWLLSQLAVASWLAGEAQQRETGWATGLSPWHWDFGTRRAIVWPGSHGLELARHDLDELSLIVPDDGVVNLSLALNDQWIALDAVDEALLDIDSSAPVRLMLLTRQAAGGYDTWARMELNPGTRRAAVPLSASPRVSPSLLLRMEAEPGSRVRLRSLALVNTACTAEMPCSGFRRSAPQFATPELLLDFRDAHARQSPTLSIEAGGPLGHAGRHLHALFDGASSLLLRFITLALLAMILLAVFRRLLPRGRRFSPRRSRWELAIPLGAALCLLLAGWPARETPLHAGAILLLCLVTLALLPPPERAGWQWLGDGKAWRASMAFTLVAALLLAPLMLFDEPPGSRQPEAAQWLRYPVWALLQQWLLITAITPRLRQITASAGMAALGSGIVFGLMHAPNFGLMLFTLFGGTAWALLGQRHRALLPLAASHALLGLWLVYAAPPWLLRSAEIGGRYLMTP